MTGFFRNTIIGMFFAGFAMSHANATVIFFTDETAFLNASTTTLITFEGLVGDDGFIENPANNNAFVTDSVTFQGITGTGIDSDIRTLVCGKDACTGNPHNSAILVSAFAHDLNVDLSTAGTGFTAVGGFFGDIDGVGGSATLELLGAEGTTLDTQVIDIAGLMSDDLRFFGWLSTNEEITGLNFLNGPADSNGENFEALDNFRFGLAEGLEIPEPAALALFGFGLVGLHLVGRRRRR